MYEFVKMFDLHTIAIDTCMNDMHWLAFKIPVQMNTRDYPTLHLDTN